MPVGRRRWWENPHCLPITCSKWVKEGEASPETALGTLKQVGYTGQEQQTELVQLFR